jgi:hypothetical protein
VDERQLPSGDQVETVTRHLEEVVRDIRDARARREQRAALLLEAMQARRAHLEGRLPADGWHGSG